MTRFWMWLAFVVMLPVALGPARTTIERALGGEPAHTCACGMKRGTCGCPACERLEQEAKKASKHVAIRNACEDDDGFVRAPAVPLVISSFDSQLAREPSTPPPRT